MHCRLATLDAWRVVFAFCIIISTSRPVRSFASDKTFIILIQFCAYKMLHTNCAHKMLWRSKGRICLTTLSPQPHAELLQRGFLYAIKLAECYGVGGVALRTLFFSRRSRDFNAIYLFFCIRFLTKFIAYADTQKIKILMPTRSLKLHKFFSRKPQNSGSDYLRAMKN